MLSTRLFQEAPLPAVRSEAAAPDRQALEEVLGATKYFVSANVYRAACYVPQAIAFGVARSWAGLAYVGAVWAGHAFLVCVEVYKRALCEHWLARPGIEAEVPSPGLATAYKAPTGFFRLMSFETARFYRRLGLEAFRQFVTWVMNRLTHGFSGERLAFLSRSGRSEIARFEEGTRVSETVHWATAATVVPLVAFSWHAAPWGVTAWSAFIVWSDVMLALLQRYHRARVMPMLRRIEGRAS